MTARILLTGGTGFIGSHTYVALVDAGYDVVIVDDFSNSDVSVPDRLEDITGRPVKLHRVNVLDEAAMSGIFAGPRIDAVLHLAARKSVPQSLARPQSFFDENIAGLLTLLRVMDRFEVRNIVYSSSATVYGQPEALPIPEHAPLSYTNPYGLSKLLGEQFLNQKSRCGKGWAVGILRYFNPAGAHPSGLIGEEPRCDGGNLMPSVARAAMGLLPHITVFGTDYGTIDGTAMRDFIHVCDLAEGHVLSLRHLLRTRRSHTINLGRGHGYTVLQVVRAFERASGTRIPLRMQPRREGDVAASFADPAMARAVLGFQAQRDLAEICRSGWRWQLRRYGRGELRDSLLKRVMIAPPGRATGHPVQERRYSS